MSQPTAGPDIEALFASFALALQVAIADHKMDVILGRSPAKLAEYCLSCFAALNELQRKE